RVALRVDETFVTRLTLTQHSCCGCGRAERSIDPCVGRAAFRFLLLEEVAPLARRMHSVDNERDEDGDEPQQGAWRDPVETTMSNNVAQCRERHRRGNDPEEDANGLPARHCGPVLFPHPARISGGDA